MFIQASASNISYNFGFVKYGTFFDDTMMGSSQSETFYVGAGQDFIFGNGGADSIDAGAGNDYANGGSGNDRVFGGSGFDFLVDGDGADTIEGGKDNDTIWLSNDSDQDTIIFSDGDGHDVVYGFDTDEDVLDLSGFGFDNILDFIDRTEFSESGGSLTLSFDTGDSITLAGVDNLPFTDVVL